MRSTGGGLRERWGEEGGDRAAVSWKTFDF